MAEEKKKEEVKKEEKKGFFGKLKEHAADKEEQLDDPFYFCKTWNFGLEWCNIDISIC